jgi:hypothetical protein
MTKKTRNWLIALSILAFPFVLFLGFLAFMEEPLPPVAPLPNPNGYEDLVKAGEMTAAESGNYDEMNAVQLRELASKNTGALALARAGLSNQCRVPVQFSETYVSNHLDDLASLKRMAQAFLAEGRLAEMENRPNDAAKPYLDVVHLGNESARGGALIDQLVGIAIESIGTSPLQKLVPQLDAKSCRESAAILETLDDPRQTKSSSLRYRLAKLMESSSAKNKEKAQTGKAQSATKRKLEKQQTNTRQLMIALAARAYELDKGHPPAGAADLVPEYLKAVPQDPVTGTNLVYAP